MNATHKKNLIWIIPDGMRSDQLACYGGWGATTTLDTFAENGVRFDQAITQGTWTVLSFASFLTGLYPVHNGVSTIANKKNSPDGAMPCLLDSYTTLYDHLVEYGYTTRTYSLRVLGTSMSYKNWGIVEKDADMVSEAILCDLDHLLMADRPFFLVLRYAMLGLDLLYKHFDQPVHHSRLCEFLIDRLANQSGFAESLQEVFRESMRDIDQRCWRPIHTLLQEKGSENTFISVFSDHGNVFWDRKDFGPQTVSDITHGRNVYEPAIKVPFIITGPGVPKGKKIDELVRLVDVVPTMLSLLEVPPLTHPSGTPLDGIDLSRAILGNETLEPRDAFSNAMEQVSLRTNDFKIIQDLHTGNVRMYDIKNDPQECFDISRIHTHECMTLYSRLSALTGLEYERVLGNECMNTGTIRSELVHLGYLPAVEINEAAEKLKQHDAFELGIILYVPYRSHYFRESLEAAVRICNHAHVGLLVCDHNQYDTTHSVLSEHDECALIRINERQHSADVLNLALEYIPAKNILVIDPGTILDCEAVVAVLEKIKTDDLMIACCDLTWCDDSLQAIEDESEINQIDSDTLATALSVGSFYQYASTIVNQDIIKEIDGFRKGDGAVFRDLFSRLAKKHEYSFLRESIAHYVSTATGAQKRDVFKQNMVDHDVLKKNVRSSLAVINSRTFLERYGRSLIARGEYQESYAIFARLRSLYPDYIHGIYFCAYLAKELGLFDESLNAYRALAEMPYSVSSHHEHVSGCFNAGDMLYQRGELSTARAFLDACLLYEPHHTRAHKLCDQIHYHAQDAKGCSL